jgi:CSLREA domain-containing protein
MIKSLVCAVFVFILTAVIHVSAQVSLTSIGVPASQDFDTLASSGTDIPFVSNTTIPGWYATRTLYNASNGSDTAGTLYSFRTAASATDRALGSVAAGNTGTVRYGVRLRNDTGIAITGLDVSFVGEQWRKANNAAQHTLTFDYRQAENVSDLIGTYIAVPQLDFAAPIFGATTATAIDGNLAANRIALSHVIDVMIPPGEEIMLRWSDVDDAGNDHGFGIDDFSVTPLTANHGTLRFSSANYSGLEDKGPVTITVKREDGSDGAVSVGYGVAAFRAGRGFLRDDHTVDLARLYDVMHVAEGGGGRGALTYVRATDTRATDTRAADTRAAEGSGGRGALTYVRAADTRATDTRVTEFTGAVPATGGASCTAGVDYITPGGTLNWADSDADDKTFDITICPDSDFEPDEVFVIELTDATGGATLGKPSAANVFILNDDIEPTPTPTPKPITLIVDTTGDGPDADPGDGSCATAEGACTLRAAVEEANTLAGPQAIEFDLDPAPAFGGPQTIVLSSGTEIAITGDLLIAGPGADLLTIDGGPGANRIFFIDNSAAEISGMTLTGGNGGGAVDSGSGGAIYATGSLTLDAVSVDTNSVSGGGGGVRTGSGTHTIRNSAVINNTALGCGGIFNFNGTLTIINSTVSGNSIAAGQAGGGICTSGASAQTTVQNSTVTANSAPSFAAGIFNSDAGAVTNIASSIVAGNIAPSMPDIWLASGSVVSAGFNLIGSSADTGEPVAYHAADILDTPPMLGPLQDNGGPTLTHRLLGGSPAIDRGNSFGLLTDQRGFARIVDILSIPNAADGADIGAFESLGPTAASVSIAGRVLAADGTGIANVIVTAGCGGLAEPLTVRTNTFGYYRFEGLSAGSTCFVTVNSRRYLFAIPSVAVTPDDDLDGVNFTALP